MKLKGTAVSKGVVIGKAFIYTPFKPEVIERSIEQSQIEKSLQEYEQLKADAEKELQVIIKKMEETDPDKAGIFMAHSEILKDAAMDEEIIELIEKELMAPECAIDVVYEKYIQILASVDDAIMKERADDIKDVKRRLLRIWFQVENLNLSDIDEPSIVFAHDLLPSDTAALNKDMVLAIVTEVGGSTSHSAILARSYGIPAVLGVQNVLSHISSGEELIVDALDGVIITEPLEEEKEIYSKKGETYHKKAEAVKKFIDVKPIMKDNTTIKVFLNIGSASDEELQGEKYTDGIGLFRSEFLYMEGSTIPDEQTQFEAYKKVVTAFGKREVILRTLDIGGDKTLESMELPKEDNPFLGLRALRLCFEKKELFQTQLRAALRASSFGNLSIMFPMVGSMEDIRQAKEIVEEVKSQLKKEGTPFNEAVKIGIMIEIPSIAVIADLAAKEVDFASIGTNDLCQYLMAVDRLNPQVSKYYQSYHPAMFRMIKTICDAFCKEGKEVSICGEMGGDSVVVPVLIGLGVKKLSMNLSSVAAVKKVITSLTMEKAEEIAQTVTKMTTAEEIENYLLNLMIEE